MASFTVTVPATTNGTISLASTNSASMTPARGDNSAAGIYTFHKPAAANPEVDVTASPNSGYVIASWSSNPSFSGPAGDVLKTKPSGNSSTIEVTQQTTIAAPTFVQYHTVTINTSGSGTVEVAVDDDPSPVSGTTVTVYVKSGTSIGITNTPGSGYQYESTSGSTTITADTNVTVTFVPIPAPPASTDDFTKAEDSDFLSQQETSARKHLLLKVPDYELTTHNRYLAVKNSYAQLGDATEVSNNTTQAEGNDLLAASYDQPSRITAASTFSFLDDIRNRGTSTAFGFTGSLTAAQVAAATPPSEQSSRSPGNYSHGATSANTKASTDIPNYVGWRDHTDGHRITTTRGDKIEIIGGNYKIVSLGRGTGVAAYEMSGGIITDAQEPPGNQTSVTWRDCPTDSGNKGWQVVRQTVKGNEIARYHGTQREEFYGNKQISVVGSPSENTVAADFTASAEGAVETITSLKVAGHSSDAVPTKWDQRAGLPPKLEQPKIYESTWADSITSYTKVKNKVHEEVHYEGGIETHTYVTGVLDSHTHWFHMLGSIGHVEHFHGMKTEFFFGASTTVGLANRFELFVGSEEQMNVGLMLNLQVPQKLNITLNEAKVGLNDLDTKLKRNIVHLRNDVAALSSNVAALEDNNVALTENQVALTNQVLALQNRQ